MALTTKRENAYNKTSIYSERNIRKEWIDVKNKDEKEGISRRP